MKCFINRLFGVLLIMIGIILIYNYYSDNNHNELYYDNFKYTSNVVLGAIDGYNFDYSATLNDVGDYYEIDFDVINTTAYDMEIDTLDINKDDQYITYRLSYESGDLVNEGDVIKTGESKTLRYIVFYQNEILKDNYNFDSSFNINYKQYF